MTNLTIAGSAEQAMSLVDCGAIPSLCALLVREDLEVILLVLDAILQIVRKSAERQNDVCLMIEECGGRWEFASASSMSVCMNDWTDLGLESIERLQHHDNEQIYLMAYEISTYFNHSDHGESDSGDGSFTMDPGFTF